MKFLNFWKMKWIYVHACWLITFEVSVRVLWKSIQNHHPLIACLPNESKDILFKNGIMISTPTSRPPSFNYAAFIKNLSMGKMIMEIIKIHEHNDEERLTMLVQEILKM